MKIVLLKITLLLIVSICHAQDLFKPLPPVENYNENIVNLGKELFYDKILSKNQDTSCYSCHDNYGADTKQFSQGHDGNNGNMNAPSVFNLPYNLAYFWNGRSKTLKEQMITGPLINDNEMASSEELIEGRLLTSEKYQKLFKKAYNHNPTFEKMLDAISEYEKTLISINSKFDKYLRNEVELDENEKNGMELFISYGCVSCHNGINIGGNSYQKFGSVIEYDQKRDSQWQDRFSVTNKVEDINVYKVPSLRNVDKTSPYFHDGSIENLKDAIYTMAYFNVGVVLEENEINDIESFLKTLTGEIPKNFENKR